MKPLSRKLLVLLVLLSGSILSFTSIQAAAFQSALSKIEPTALAPGPPPLPTHLPDTSILLEGVERQTDSEFAQAPTISFIDSPTAACFLPIPGTDACYIRWDYLYVTTENPNYLITMTVKINDRNQAQYNGFFQNYFYVPAEFMLPGFRVACGLPTSPGSAGLGRQYNYQIRARDTSGLNSSNSGSVTCPTDPGIRRQFLPVVRK